VSESNISVGSSSHVTDGTVNRNDAPSAGTDSSARNGPQSSDPADVRQQALLFRSLMDAPITVRQLAELATRNADVELAEKLSELGAEYLKLKQMDKAAESFEALLKLKPADAAGQLNLGIALYNQGVAFLAQKNYDEAQKKLDAAEAHLREAIKLNTPGYAAHYYLGLLLINFKAFEEAQKEFELAINNGGENLALAHKFLGGAYLSTHKNKEAADELEKYLKLEPKAPDADRIKETIKGLRGKQ